MEGVVQWAALVFISSIALGSIAVAWGARGFIATLELKIADLTKDVRHLKANLGQHAVNYTEMHDDQIRLKAEVDRLTKIVNGKH